MLNMFKFHIMSTIITESRIFDEFDDDNDAERRLRPTSYG